MEATVRIDFYFSNTETGVSHASSEACFARVPRHAAAASRKCEQHKKHPDGLSRHLRRNSVCIAWRLHGLWDVVVHRHLPQATRTSGRTAI